ncbi:MAG TPA: alpha/beta fold hydrolase [Polyangiaceae bacterium]|jgi:pimeloyl-ACP methyl ester carboxylesterase
MAALADIDMGVHPRRGPGIRLALVVAGDLALALFSSMRWEDVGAEAIVRAPNKDRAQPPAAPGELRFDVGPPAAVLSVVCVDPPRPRGTVFVLHGIRDSRDSMPGWGRMLAMAGYRAVLVDLRGQGRSSGDALAYGTVESCDLVQVLDALEARQCAIGEVGVMGNSYGAATAIQWAGRDARVRAVVAVSPFASLRAVVPGYLPLRLPAAFVDRAIARAGVRGGFDPDAASPVDAIARTRAPVLLIHGAKDVRIPPWHSERIHAAGRDHSELVLVDGEGHDTVPGARATHLAERAADWFGKHLR